MQKSNRLIGSQWLEIYLYSSQNDVSFLAEINFKIEKIENKKSLFVSASIMTSHRVLSFERDHWTDN
jgi:hypothetical protein